MNDDFFESLKQNIKSNSEKSLYNTNALNSNIESAQSALDEFNDENEEVSRWEALFGSATFEDRNNYISTRNELEDALSTAQEEFDYYSKNVDGDGYSNYLDKQASSVQSELDDYVENEQVSFWGDTVFGDSHLSDYKESKATIADYEDEISSINETKAANEYYQETKTLWEMSGDELIAGEQSLQDELAELQSQRDSLSNVEFNQGEVESSNERANWSFSDVTENSSELDAIDTRIAEIENEITQYTQIYQANAASQALTDVPDDVISLLDEYNIYTQTINNAYSTTNSQTDLSTSLNNLATVNSATKEVEEAVIARDEIAASIAQAGYDNYEELAEYRYSITQNEELSEQIEAIESWSRDNSALGFIAARGLSTVSGISGVMGAIENAATENEGLGTDTSSIYFAASKYGDAFDSGVTSSFENGLVSSDTKEFLYGVGSSGVDSLVASAVPGGSVMLGAGAFTDTYIAASENGASESDALLTGIAAGAAETIFEQVSIGNLKAFSSVTSSSIKDVALNISKSVLVNASEEAATEVANIVADYLINGGASDYSSAYLEAINQGMSEAEAKSYASMLMAETVGESALSGAIMGGAFGAVGSVQGAVASKAYEAQATYEAGKEISESGQTEELINYGTNSSNSEISTLAQNIKQTLETAEGKAENLGEDYYRNLSELNNLIDADKTSNIQSSTIQDITDDLELNYNITENVDVLASAVYKTINEQKLTSQESKAYKASEAAQTVAQEAIANSTYSSDSVVAEQADTTQETSAESDSNDFNEVQTGQNTNAVVNESETNLDDSSVELDNTVNNDVAAVDADFEEVGIDEVQVTSSNASPVWQKSEYYSQAKNIVAGENVDSTLFDTAFVYGLNSLSLDEVMQTTVSESFTADQAQSAYAAGEMARAEQVENRKKSTDLIDEAVSKITSKESIVFINGYNQALARLESTQKASNIASAYIQSYDYFAKGGKYNTEMSADEFLNRAESKSLFEYIDKDTATQVFETAQNKAIEQQEKENAKKKESTVKKVKEGEFKDEAESKASEEMTLIYKGLAKHLDLDIKRVESLFVDVNNFFLEANASFNAQLFSIVINAQSVSEFNSLMHELGHAVATFAPTQAKQLYNALKNWYCVQYGIADFDNAIEQYKAENDLKSDFEAYEEMMSDAVSMIFSTPEGIKDFVDFVKNGCSLTQEQSSSIIKKITSVFSKIIDALRSIVGINNVPDAAKRFAQMQEEQAKKIRYQFLQALEDSSTNYKNGVTIKAGIEYSLVRESDDSLQVHEILEQRRMVNRSIRELNKLIDYSGLSNEISKATSNRYIEKVFENANIKRGNNKALKDNAYAVFNRLANIGDMNSIAAEIAVNELAENIANSVDTASKVDFEAKQKLKQIRNFNFKLDFEQIAALSYAGITNKKFYSTVLAGPNERSDVSRELDSAWGEISDILNLDRETSSADQAVVLFEKVSQMKELKKTDFERQNTDGLSKEEFINKTAGEIKLSFVEISNEIEISKMAAKKRSESEAEKYEKKIAALKEKQKAKLAEAKLLLYNSYKSKIDSKLETIAKSKTRDAVRKNVRKLSRMLNAPTNANYIPEDLRKMTAEFLSAFTNDNSVFNSDKLLGVRKAYQNIINSAGAPGDEITYSSFEDKFDIEFLEIFDSLEKTLKNKRLARLNIEEITAVNKIVDHFSRIIRNETEMFVAGKKQITAEIGVQAREAIDKAKVFSRQNTNLSDGKKNMLEKGNSAFKSFKVSNLTPQYFFEKVGGVFKDFYWDLIKAQNNYMQISLAAKQKYDATVKKYGADKWLNDEAEMINMASITGKKISLTFNQAAALWATAKREQTSKKTNHLKKNGFVLKEQYFKIDGKIRVREATDKSKIILTEASFERLSSVLTKEQKAFIDEMVRFLSSDMAAIGNKVSMDLYGWKKFGEGYYFPISVSSVDIKGDSNNGRAAKLRNMGHSKAVTVGAKNAIQIGNFTDVWAEHTESMAAYGSFVIPLENFNKVWNWVEIVDEEDSAIVGDEDRVKAAFENKFGTQMQTYIEKLISDVNGNRTLNAETNLYAKLFSKFKKAAVVANLSVAIQQPMAVIRATALLDTKYLVKGKYSKSDRQRMLDNAPVALLKDVGGFDTSTGTSISDWIKSETHKDSLYERMDKAASWGASEGDMRAWTWLYTAVEKEVKATKPSLSGEKYTQAVVDRFTEIVTMTQVYDSVLVKSGNMRSNSEFMKVATAFKGEPTLSANMVNYALEIFKTDKKKAARFLSSYFTAAVFTGGFKAFVSALRDDDEDNTYWEKYIAQLASVPIDALFPFNDLPFLSEISSILQGFDSESSQFALMSDFVTTIQSFYDKTIEGEVTLEECREVCEVTANLFGVPLENAFREFEGVFKTLMNIGDKSFSWSGVKLALEKAGFLTMEAGSDSEIITDAFINGDDEIFARYANNYDDEAAITSAISEEIGNRVKAGTLDEETAVVLLVQNGKDESDAIVSVFKWVNGYSGIYSGLDDAVNSEDNQAEAMSDAINALLEIGYDQDDIDSEIKQALRDESDDVDAAAIVYEAGDMDGFLEYAQSISEEYGIDEEIVKAAIRADAGVDTTVIEGSDYNYADLKNVISATDFDESAYLPIIEEIYNAKIDDSTTGVVKAALDSSLSSVFTDEEVNEILANFFG